VPGSGANVDVRVLPVVWVALGLLWLGLSALAFAFVFGGTVALTRDPFQSLDGRRSHPRDGGRSGSDRMERIHGLVHSL
jgi:hypothetical protein